MFRGMYRGSSQGGGGEPVNYNRVVEKIAVIPSAETTAVGKVYMYMGESNATYTHGYIYECVATQTATAVSFSGNIVSNWAVADFISYLQEGGAEYNEVTHGTLTYDATGDLWVLVGFDANGIQVMQFQEYTEDLEEFGCTFASATHQDGDSCNFTLTTEESGKKWKRLDVQPASQGGGAVASVNGKTGVVILNAEDVGALANTTKYVVSASWTIDSSTYVMTLQLKDQDGANIGTAQTIDLPLESVVVGGSYDSTNKKIVLTLNNGTTIDVPVADLVSGLQSEITAQNPLSAGLVDDTNTTHKFVSAAEKSTWNGKQDAISDLATIRSGAAAGATAVQPGNLATVATTGDYDDLTNKPTIPAAQVNSDWNASGGVAQILNKPTLGSAASANTTDFATAAQGAKADTAVQPSAIADMETQTHASATYATKAELADKQNIMQYSTMPTASADNVGDIVQFVGTTDSTYTNGYFYKCVSDGQDPATYSWEEVSLGGSSLPDQTGQSGKYLTTDGSSASWGTINALQDEATRPESLSIGASTSYGEYGPVINYGYNTISDWYGVCIGSGNTVRYHTTTIGLNSSAGNYGIAIGEGISINAGTQLSICIQPYNRNSGTTIGYEATGSILIGCNVKIGDYANNAIQIGCPNTSTATVYTNNDANTFKVGNANGNFEIMSADGTIPEARLADTTNAAQGMVLTLDSNLNAVWQSSGSGGGISDVTVNGTSVVSGGVAAITMPMIDDTSTTSTTATWSASKLNTTIGDIETLINAL